MSVWFCVPSARPNGGTIHKWREAGYNTAILRDPARGPVYADIVIQSSWPGYYQATSILMRKVFEMDPDCEWCVGGGDDTFPPYETPPGVIASECFCLFGNSFGCMQPTGDPWRDMKGKIIDRIAGSPWIGREFFRRMYGGTGPWWHEYTHCFGDEELQCVAQKLGVFWQRADLTHFHDHWSRSRGNVQDMPDFLRDACSQEHWAKYGSIFRMRKAAGFPGHEPIP